MPDHGGHSTICRPASLSLSPVHRGARVDAGSGRPTSQSWKTTFGVVDSPRRDARTAAKRAFGNVEHVKELHRDTRSFRWLDDARQDAHYALRSLMRSPGFFLVVGVTLTLGIGASTGMFSVIRAVLLQPLPFDRERRLVRLMVQLPAADSPTGQPVRMRVSLSEGETAELTSRTAAFSYVGAIVPSLRSLRGSEEAARLVVTRLSSSMFHMLAHEPADRADARPRRR